jgi:dATP pyrophosphohydrolase
MLMGRAPFQILVFPYRFSEGQLHVALFRRTDDDSWQGIAGGGQDDELPIQAAVRETNEESGLSCAACILDLETVASVPAACFQDRHLWGEDIATIPEYSFAVHASNRTITLSNEHTEFEWLSIDDAMTRVRYESNRAALRKLSNRVRSTSTDG